MCGPAFDIAWTSLCSSHVTISHNRSFAAACNLFDKRKHRAPVARVAAHCTSSASELAFVQTCEMGIEQSRVGKLILVLGSVAFAYYSIWILSAVRRFICALASRARAHWAGTATAIVGYVSPPAPGCSPSIAGWCVAEDHIGAFVRAIAQSSRAAMR